MKYVTECLKSELDLFEIPPLDTSNEDGYWSYYSRADLTTQGELVFNIESNNYLDLSSCMLYVVAKIRQKQNSEAVVTSNDKVGLVNNFLHSLFKNVSVKINNDIVDSSTNDLYPYKAYILNLLNYGHEEKTTFLSSSLFYKDDAKEIDNFNVSELTSLTIADTKSTSSDSKTSPPQSSTINNTLTRINQGFLKRRAILLDGNGKLELMGHLYCDLFNTNKLFLNNSKLTITLYKNDDSFCLLGDDADKFEIFFEEVKLRIRNQKISDQVKNAHNLVLVRNPAVYFTKSVEVKSFKQLSTVGSSITKEISIGKTPNILIIGLNKYAYDKQKKNPFNFENMNVTELELKVEDIQKPYSYQLKFDYSKNLYLNGYMSLFDVASKTDLGNNISREDFPNGYTLYGFNLQPNINCGGDMQQILNNSKITIKIEFAQNSPTTIFDLIVYKEYDKFIQIDSDRKLVP